MKNFNLNRVSGGSRPSDTDNPEIFKPTTHDMNDADDDFGNTNDRQNTHEGVDDYDEEYDKKRKGMGSKARSSLVRKQYEFEGI